MPQLIEKNLDNIQNKRIAIEIVNDLSVFINNGKLDKVFLEEQISKTLTAISGKDKGFAKSILSLLNEKYPDYKFRIDLP